MPKYSVIMTTYNRAAYLRQAVDSVLGQTYRDLELIVCDDGSTDDTQAILNDYGGRIRTLSLPHKGQGSGLNAALAVAQGEFVSILDSDDFWMPWTLEQVDKVVEALEQPACVYLRPTYFGGDGIPSTPTSSMPTSFRVFDSYATAPAHVPDGSGMLGAMPRQALVTAGGFWPWPYSCGDGDLIFRLSRKMGYASLDTPVTVCVRQHPGRSMRSVQSRFKGVDKVLDNYRKGMYGHGADDPLLAVRVGRLAVSQSLDLAVQFGAWRESARLFRRTLRVCPRRQSPGASVFWYGGFLIAIMASRLLEQLSRYCSRHLTMPWSDPNRNTPSV